MLAHLRANLWLLLLTLLLCCVLYPLTLLGVAQLPVFHDQAQGSLVYDQAGEPVGSRLIAQNFTKDQYFWPRPSATSPDPYKADASGASNYGANNPLLRDRVARTVGLLVRYKAGSPTGHTVQEDVAEWFQSRPNIVAEWVERYPSSAQAWVNADDKHKDAVTAWQKDHPEAVAAWKKTHPDEGEPKPTDLADAFFRGNAAAFHKAWPKLIEDATWSVEAVFFDSWLQAHRGVKLEEVPADLVLTSGSGLDPHITLKNALYQLDRVAGKWAEITKGNRARVRTEIEELLRRNTEAPLAGLAGVELVNVLEVNLALRDRYEGRRTGGK
jgi:K+-transporting ATPase ATPase C chain